MSHIGFEAHKLPLPPNAPRDTVIQHRKAMLYRVLRMKTVVAVVGSGCTIPLGYPDWTNFALQFVERVIDRLQALPPTRRTHKSVTDELSRFEGFRARLKPSEPPQSRPSSESLMFFITACQGVAERVPELRKWSESYSAFLKDTFDGRNRPKSPDVNPCAALLDLPITRFVTTNYDGELERALTEKRRIPWKRFGIDQVWVPGNDPSPLSFTQTGRHMELLARFALARTHDNDNMVFHCHGRFDDTDSIIASEADYQKWYVTDVKGAGPAFRQTIELLLESNPLFFVGYGMGDYDFLRPLRQLGALDPNRKKSKPLFALFVTTKGRDEELHFEESLYERYGLHVIPLEQQEGEVEGKTLVDGLTKLKAEFIEARDEWLRKPTVRKPPSAPLPASHYIAYDLDPGTLTLLRSIPVEDRLQKLEEALDAKKAKAICVVGPAGTGKTENVLRLLEKRGGDFDGCFYWNAHYANEAFTALEAAVSYLDPEGLSEGTRHDRVIDRLRKGRYLVAIDGCERLLRAGRRAAEGVAYGAGFGQLLQMLKSALKAGDFNSTVLFSGRLWPSELVGEEKPGQLGLEEVTTDRVRASDVVTLKLLPPPLTQHQVSELCSLLHGHGYGLLLASRLLLRTPGKTQELLRALSEQTPKKRFGAMVDQVLDNLGDRTGGFGPELLDRLALFVEPVSLATVEACFLDVRTSRGRKPTSHSLETLLQELASDGLLLVALDRQEIPSYMVHASIRNHLGRRARGSITIVLPDFAVVGFTGGTNGMNSGSEEREQTIERLFERLSVSARSARSAHPGEARRMVRDAYGLLRSQRECNTTARTQSYGRYMRLGIDLWSLAKEFAPGLWTYCDPSDFHTIEHADSSLYVAELAWLYNDIGLALFSEGLMADAFSVWEQALEINRVLESSQPYGEYVVESLLNLAHTLIELGQVPAATEYLDEAARLNIKLLDKEIESRINGFQAFCEHIRGNLLRADELYESSVKRLREGTNRRAQSFFRCLQAGVKVELKEFKQARELALESRALAEAGDYPELVAYARAAEADVLVNEGQFIKPRQAYELVQREAERMGARSLESYSLVKLAGLSLEQGDAEGARRLAMQALKLANELGLGLMTTRGLIVLGRAMVQGGQGSLGMCYLRIAERKAIRQQYGLRLREAEKYLQEYGGSIIAS